MRSSSASTAARRRTEPRRRLLLGATAAALAMPRALRAAPAPLVCWFTVEGAKAMRAVGERFTADTGVPVVVETPDEGPAKFQQAAGAGKGPDIYVYAHDRIGEWIAAGLLHAVDPSPDLWADIDPLAWRGFTLRGRTWGYPYAIEAITLIHNLALVPEPPRDWASLIALDDRLARDGRRAVLWDYTNGYFSWPLLAAHGGYAFRQRADGGWDPSDTGVANAGALQGARLLDRLIREGRMPTGSGYADMEAAMAQGRVAMVINGPWAWVNLRRVGMDFGIARIPALAGRPAAPFVGIKGLMINRATRQRELAVEFIEHYLLQPEGLRAIDRAEPIGAAASRRFFAQQTVDPRIAGIMDCARDGVPTPSVPEMGRFWAALKTALTNLTEGRQDPAAALQAAARRIRGE
ncbi:maltose/maltodextrin ABC transporter substrate-binding protein MalE [Rubrivivax albus]|uniref:Maltodextrin-binding protein n=1 Tax=Rubrivivax albus TaxID=2499835 RepID=A0A3S2U8W6_9BURK|nr:maltose/maltodextrin ABC transporter substrate-binding protein MalE [Rubrivivax albus]RVT51520.1 maltose/maltodextrin ABC transporter substrate-binding protein MalE [Rubrivivax albus]